MRTNESIKPALRFTASRSQRGMTLVELMVALLLGLVTTYFIAQVFAVAEGQKRTATFGTDAQINGAVALHTLRRHVQSAGYGVTSVFESWGCPIKGAFGTSGSATPMPAMTLSPIQITPGVSASAPSDSLAVLTSTKTTFSAPVRIKQGHEPIAGQAAAFVVEASLGAKEEDVILAMPKDWTASAGNCTLFTVKQDTSSPQTTLSKEIIPHVPSGSASSWNAAASSVWPSGGFVVGDVIVNFGKIRRMVFGVSNSGDAFQVVTWTPEGVGNAELLNSNIVLMKALYGRDTNNDGAVDTYDTTPPVTQADWQKVLTVRLVMVARSGQRERDIVTTAEPTWNVGSNVAVSYTKVPGGAATVCAAAGTACEVSLPLAQLNEWQHYRYKVFDTAIPLRNMIWNLGS